MKGDLVDDADDLADFLSRFGDGVHGADSFANHHGAARRFSTAEATMRCALSAPSADILTVAVVSSSAAALCSRLAACCAVRRARLFAADEISSVPEWMAVALSITCFIASSRWPMAALKSLCSRP